MLAHKVLLPGATTLERFVAKLRHRVDVRVWRVLASGISPPQQRRLEDLLRVPDEGRSSSLVTLRTGAAMVSGPALVRALERLNAVRSLSITVPAAAAIAPTRIAALARFAEKAKGVRLFFVEDFSPYSWALLPADASPQWPFREGHQAGQRVPASFRQPAEPRHGAEHLRSSPRQARSLLDIRAAFWYGAVGREADLRWL